MRIAKRKTASMQINLLFTVEQGWHSGESARLTPMYLSSIPARCHVG